MARKTNARKTNLVRKNIYIPDFVNDYLVKEAEKRGLTQSNVISLALQEQMKQEKAKEENIQLVYFLPYRKEEYKK